MARTENTQDPHSAAASPHTMLGQRCPQAA